MNAIEDVWLHPKTPEEWERVKDIVRNLSRENQIHYYRTGEIKAAD